MKKLGAMIVDDEKKIVRHLKTVIPWEQYGIDQVEEAFNGADALNRAKEFQPDLILCDIRMPVMDGFSFLARLREYDLETEVILLTAYQDFEYARSAIKYRVHDYLLKPIDYEDLGRKVESLAQTIRGKRAGYSSGYSFHAADALDAVPSDGAEDSADGSGEALWAVTEDLLSGLKRCDRSQTEYHLRQMADLLYATSHMSAARSEQMAHFTALHLLREMKELDVIGDAVERDIWRRMEGGRTVRDMLDVIERIARASLESIVHRRSGEKLMLSARDYIGRHLSRDIGVDELSGQLGISASYFSLLFKQHFGETFVEYVTRQRVEMAKSLLLMTDKSITEIGRTVGYAERRYFSKVFQRYTGDIPSAFREKMARKRHESSTQPNLS